MKWIFTLSFFILISSSCSSLKKAVDDENRVMLNESNFTTLEGKYSLRAIDNKGGSLHYALFASDYSNIFSSHPCSDSLCYIEIKALDDKTLSFSFLNKKNETKTRKLKGKLKKGYFELGQRHLFLPFIFTNMYRNRSLRIGKLKNGNLITDQNMISAGTALIVIPFYMNDKYFNIEYPRLLDTPIIKDSIVVQYEPNL